MEREEKDTTEEVEEQGARPRFREAEPADEGVERSDSDDDGGDSEVEEQKRMSDATLKQGIAPIAAALSALA